MKYRLSNFCSKSCRESYEGFVSIQAPGAFSESFLNIWEFVRRLHHRCFYCSAKLPKSRQRSIG